MTEYLLDGWVVVQMFLTPFRVESSDEEKLQRNLNELESGRITFANVLMRYVIEKGYGIIPNLDEDDRRNFTIANPILSKKIEIPTHIVTPDPNEDIQGRQLTLRQEIPILYFLSGIGHETTHLDRYFSDPVIADRMERMVREGYVGQQDWTTGTVSEFVDEEISTDTQNFFLLRGLGIPILPENFCSFVGRGYLYQSHVFNRLRE